MQNKMTAPPLQGISNLMKMQGRMGDTELVHMSPMEVKGLASLGRLTRNPDTGLPEAFNLEDEMTGLSSLMNMPSAKQAMTDLMQYGKEKLKTLTMKDIQKEMPEPQDRKSTRLNSSH